MRKTILTLLVALLILGCNSGDPIINGKTESQWIQQINNPTTSDADKLASIYALSRINNANSVIALKSAFNSGSVESKIASADAYVSFTGKGAEVVPMLKSIIHEKETWAYTPQLASLLSKIGSPAKELSGLLVNRQQNSPNSQYGRWQSCIDAIK